MKRDIYYCTSCQEEFEVKHNKAPQYCPYCANEVDYSHTVDPEDLKHKEDGKEKLMEIPYEIIKEKYADFVAMFLSGEQETVKVEFLPNLWVVTNEKHDFKATIECEYEVRDFRTMKKEWFAVVTVGNERSHFMLDVSKKAVLSK